MFQFNLNIDEDRLSLSEIIYKTIEDKCTSIKINDEQVYLFGRSTYRDTLLDEIIRANFLKYPLSLIKTLRYCRLQDYNAIEIEVDQKPYLKLVIQSNDKTMVQLQYE
jgi:hypothetical protein